MYRYGRVAPQDWQNFPEATFEDGNMCDWIGPLPKGQVLRLRFGAKTMLGHVLVCFALVGVGCCRLEPSIRFVIAPGSPAMLLLSSSLIVYTCKCPLFPRWPERLFVGTTAGFPGHLLKWSILIQGSI